jgi:5'-nucleotidase
VIATNDFIAAGGGGYTMIAEAGGEVSYGALDEALISYLQTKPKLSAGTQGRMTSATKEARNAA